MIHAEHVAIFSLSVALLVGAGQRNNAMDEVSDKDPQAFGVQVSEDVSHALQANAGSLSLAEWQDSGFTASDVFQSVRAHKRADSGEALCHSLRPLPPAQLAHFESEIKRSKDLACAPDLVKKLQTHWEAQAASMPNQVQRPSSGTIEGITPGEKQIILSFNGGSEPARIERILTILGDAGVKAMFFPTGRAAQKNQDTMQKIASRGHVLGAQSSNAVFLERLSLKEAEQEILSGRSSVATASGRDVRYFRFPHGEAGENSQAIVTQNELISVPWTIDSQDWKTRAPEVLLKNLIAQIDQNSSGIVLLHDSLEQTVLVLPGLINALASRGIEIVAPATR